MIAVDQQPLVFQPRVVIDQHRALDQQAAVVVLGQMHRLKRSAQCFQADQIHHQRAARGEVFGDSCQHACMVGFCIEIAERGPQHQHGIEVFWPTEFAHIGLDRLDRQLLVLGAAAKFVQQQCAGIDCGHFDSGVRQRQCVPAGTRTQVQYPAVLEADAREQLRYLLGGLAKLRFTEHQRTEGAPELVVEIPVVAHAVSGPVTGDGDRAGFGLHDAELVCASCARSDGIAGWTRIHRSGAGRPRARCRSAYPARNGTGSAPVLDR
ncbi:MAG: hypothetical protein RQ729_05495 [Wenzhouxiangellaceae bacterium]|nr:hypothetical protein [Wenzhouxiangellaceae bacterium]